MGLGPSGATLGSHGRLLRVVCADEFLRAAYARHRAVNLTALHFAQLSAWVQGLSLHDNNRVIVCIGLSMSFRHIPGTRHGLSAGIHFHTVFADTPTDALPCRKKCR